MRKERQLRPRLTLRRRTWLEAVRLDEATVWSSDSTTHDCLKLRWAEYLWRVEGGETITNTEAEARLETLPKGEERWKFWGGAERIGFRLTAAGRAALDG